VRLARAELRGERAGIQIARRFAARHHYAHRSRFRVLASGFVFRFGSVFGIRVEGSGSEFGSSVSVLVA
jgi:hypothetical protein